LSRLNKRLDLSRLNKRLDLFSNTALEYSNDSISKSSE